MKAKFPLIYWSNRVTLQKSAGQLERLSFLLAKSTIDLNPHQIYATIFALNSPLSRGAILADEVGLGKTIEAGIIITQLWLEQKRRILIIVPASLRTQWRDELEIHFGLSATILDTPYFKGQINSGNPTPMTKDGIYIGSLPFVYNRIGLVEKQPWDLVVVDEAHRLRNVYKGRDASKMAYALREAINDKPKLLLTATPLQNNLMELYGLTSFIDDKLLGSKYFFKSRYVDPLSNNPGSSNNKLKEVRSLLVAEEEDDFFSPSGIIVRTLRKQVRGYIKFPPRKSLTQDFIPTEKEQELYSKVSVYLKRPRVAAIETTQRNLMILIYRKLLASSSFAIAPTLKKLYQRLEQELKLRDIERKAKDKVNHFPKELVSTDDLEEITELENLEIELASKGRPPKDFSDAEISAEIEELKEYHLLAKSIKKNAKGQALVSALQKMFVQAEKKGWPKKAVIFTESRRTQKYLQKILSENGISYTPFNGSNSSKHARRAYEKWTHEFPELAADMSRVVGARQALIYDFKSNSDVLLTTEAGAEGLNLQFCNVVVNYDLPWNPQRVEQRIGRCHRYGQKYEVVVANMLNTKNEADKRVLELMRQKLHLFDGLFGASDEVLGALESGVDFERRIVDIYQSCDTPEEIEAAFQKLQREMEFHLSSKIQETRAKLIEQFDAPILQLFRKTKIGVENTLSEYDQSLLRLCKEYFGDQIQPGDKPGLFNITHNGKTKAYLFREETDKERGKISRMHSDHPLIKEILQTSQDLTTKPIPTTHFKYSQSESKIKELEKYLNREGFLFLFKLLVSGIENDEILSPLAFIKKDKEFISLPYNYSRFIVELQCEQTNKFIDKSPISKDKLLQEWSRWKKESLRRFEKRNEKLYLREENRINRYWKSQTVQLDDKIAKLEKELKELERKKQNTIDFDKKRKYAQKVQKIEDKIHKQRIKKIKMEEEIRVKKMKDIEELNAKLQLKVKENLIAITRFKLI